MRFGLIAGGVFPAVAQLGPGASVAANGQPSPAEGSRVQLEDRERVVAQVAAQRLVLERDRPALVGCAL